MSLSSESRLGSMATRFTANLHVIVTFTNPAPDWPSTSVVASSSCTRRMFSCICCACFISAPIPPFIIASSFPARRCVAAFFIRLDRGGHHFGPEIADQITHERIGLDRLGGGLAALL